MTHGIYQRYPLVNQSLALPANCPVRALRYYHRYLTEHPELRKDRRRLFVPIKDNNAGKELSAPSISRWICTTIVDSHAAIQESKNLSGSVKAHEVRAVATSNNSYSALSYCLQYCLLGPAPRRSRKSVRTSGHVTGYFAGGSREGAGRVLTSGHVTGYFAGGSHEGLQRARQTQCFSRIII